MRFIIFYIAICYYITVHLTTSVSCLAFFAGACYLLLNQLQKKWIVMLFISLYSVLIIVNFDLFQQQFRLILNEFIYAINKLGLVMPLQETSANSATLTMSCIFLLLAICLSKKSWPYLLAITLCLPFLLQNSFDLLGLFILVAGTLCMQMTRKNFQLLYFIPMAGIVFASLPFENIPLFQQIGQQIEQTKADIQYNANPKAQLTNGDFNKIRAASQSEEPAFRIAMEDPRPIYLKSFVGARFDNSWYSNSQNAPKNFDITKHLKQQQDFETTQFAQASQTNTQTVSIEHIQLNTSLALTPYELDSPLGDFTFKRNRWESNRIFGESHYSYTVSETPYYEYPQIAEKIYNSKNSAYLKNEAIANYLNYDSYVAISNTDRIVLSNHFGPAKHSSFEETIQTVQSNMRALIYNKTATTLEGDFLKTLLEDSKNGHSVHYATLATLLFRYYGVPSRYVEGYIITNEDLKNNADHKELTVPFKNQHAWTEIYIDKIGWIPIEVTPGYPEKMPETLQTSFKQSTTAVAPTPQQQGSETQVQDEFIPEDPPIESKNTDPKIPWKLILVGLLLCFITVIIYAIYRLNKVELAFKRFIRKTKNKTNANLPIHRHIQQLNNAQAWLAYDLYNEIKYLQNGRYTKSQLKQLKQYLKLARKS